MLIDLMNSWSARLAGRRKTRLLLHRIPGVGETPQVVRDLAMLVYRTEDDHVSRGIREYGYWEGHETRVLLGNVQPGDVVLDVGANIGYHSVLFGALAGARGRVLSFEPAAENFCLLNQNIALNDLANVEPIAAAVSDKAGLIGLRQHNLSSGAHTIADFDDPGFVKTTLVPTVKLDDLPLDRVDFIKMDIQGAELLALDGAWNIIERNRDRLKMLLEYNVSIYVGAGERERAIATLERLRKHFSIQFCDPTIGDFYALDMPSDEFIDMAAGGQRKLPDGRQWTSSVGYSDLCLTPRA